MLSTGNQVVDICRSNDMHFVYCFFFLNEDQVIVKVGESTRPYERLKLINQGCPFPVQEAVFSHIGSFKQARKFESRVKESLKHFNIRGEWYGMKATDSEEFKKAIREAYVLFSGMPLKWSKIDLMERFYPNAGRKRQATSGARLGRPRKVPTKELTARERVLKM